VPDDATGRNPPTKTVPMPVIAPVPFAVPQASMCGTLKLDISGYLENEDEEDEDEDEDEDEELVEIEGPSVIVIVELEITSTDVIVDVICELVFDEVLGIED